MLFQVSKSTARKWVVGCALLAESSAACGPAYPCFLNDFVSSVSFGNGTMSGTPDGSAGPAAWGSVTEGGSNDAGAPSSLGFSIELPGSFLGFTLNVPQEAGTYSFQELVASETVGPLTSPPIPPSDGGVISDGSTNLDGSIYDASATSIIPALSGTVEFSSTEFSMCNSSIGCWWNYSGSMTLIDTARGIAALNVTFTDSHSGISIGMCSSVSSGDVPGL